MPLFFILWHQMFRRTVVFVLQLDYCTLFVFDNKPGVSSYLYLE